MYQSLFKPLLADLKTFALDTLFPISCVSCGEEGSFICVDCKMSLKALEHQRCIVCQKQAVFGLTHAGCQTPHGADGLISFYDYHDKKVAQIIIDGKYKFIHALYKTLAAMILPKLQNDFSHFLTTPLALTPIPLHSSRQRWRGFNQAGILAQELSVNLNLPIADVLQREKTTKTQKDLKKDERSRNVAGAFALKKGADIRGKNIILIDDVTTTGATLQEAAKVLKRNGAAKVICLTVARD